MFIDNHASFFTTISFEAQFVVAHEVICIIVIHWCVPSARRKIKWYGMVHGFFSWKLKLVENIGRVAACLM